MYTGDCHPLHLHYPEDGYGAQENREEGEREKGEAGREGMEGGREAGRGWREKEKWTRKGGIAGEGEMGRGRELH